MTELLTLFKEVFGPNAGLPALLTIICVQLFWMRKHMASKKDLQIAIFEHTRDCQNKIVEAITPIHGKSNGHATVTE